MAETHHSAKETRLNMARLSWLAYQSPDVVNQQWQTCQKLPEAECGDWTPLKAASEPPQFATCAASDAQAYAFKMGGCTETPLILACRGTSSIQDAMVDASLALVPFEFADGKQKTGVCVHKGFYQQFKGILPQVDLLYKGHLAGGGMLLCTGHSLGSGIAALAALYYAEQFPQQVAYIGFGTPRVGNPALVKTFNTVVLDRSRVANGRDPINKVPPPVGYAHVGAEVHIGRPDPYPAIPLFTDIPDHDILQGYVRGLQTDAPQANAIPRSHANWLSCAMSAFHG